MSIEDKELVIYSDNFADLDIERYSKEQLDKVEVFEPRTPFFDSMEILLNFPKLRKIAFDKCAIGDVSAINKISSIQDLAFRECNFGAPLRLPGPFPILKSLGIGYATEATGALIDDVIKFVTLEHLDLLLPEEFVYAELDALAALTQLKSLQLSRTEHHPLAFISNFTELERLHLDGVSASALDSSFSSILALPKLKSLSLSGAELNLTMDLSNLGKLDHFFISPHTDNNLEVLILWESRRDQR